MRRARLHPSVMFMASRLRYLFRPVRFKARLQHRGHEQSHSTELGRTPVAVVCAGPKSILDIGLTLEYLVRHNSVSVLHDDDTAQETQGVTVATYGPTRDFPAFYAPTSGYQVRLSLQLFGRSLTDEQAGMSFDRPEDAAELICASPLQLDERLPRSCRSSSSARVAVWHSLWGTDPCSIRDRRRANTGRRAASCRRSAEQWHRQERQGGDAMAARPGTTAH